MSQNTHFYSVKFLALKPGSVKFWTNTMSNLERMRIISTSILAVDQENDDEDKY